MDQAEAEALYDACSPLDMKKCMNTFERLAAGSRGARVTGPIPWGYATTSDERFSGFALLLLGQARSGR